MLTAELLVITFMAFLEFPNNHPKLIEGPYINVAA